MPIPARRARRTRGKPREADAKPDEGHLNVTAGTQQPMLWAIELTVELLHCTTAPLLKAVCSRRQAVFLVGHSSVRGAGACFHGFLPRLGEGFPDEEASHRDVDLLVDQEVRLEDVAAGGGEGGDVGGGEAGARGG